MKTICLIFLLALSVSRGIAQPTRPLCSAGNHATLDSVIVHYESSSSDSQQLHVLDVQPQVLVVLKPGAAVEKIFVEIRNRQDQTLLRTESYLLSASPYSEQGQLLFSGQGRHYRIRCKIQLPLHAYAYRVYTADSQGNPSNPFDTRQ